MNKLVSTILLSALCHNAYAEEMIAPKKEVITEDDQVTVIGSRVSGRLDQSTENVSVITSEELLSKNYIQLTDYLRSETGMYVKTDAAVGGTSSLFMRGTESDHVLVLVNGMRINDPSTPSGTMDFSQLTVFDVERVEVVRGPKSVVYGSQAIGGVINIILKDRASEMAKMKIEAGSNNSLNASVQLYESYKDFHFFSAAQANFIDTNEDVDENSGRYNPQKSENEQAMLRFNYTPANSPSVDLWYSYQEMNSKQVNKSRENETKDATNSQVVIAVKDSILNNSWEYKLSANHVEYERNFHLFFSGVGFTDSHTKGKSQGINLDNVHTLSDNSTLLWGLLHRQDSGEFSFGEEKVKTTAAYIEYRADLWDRLNISIGDRYEQFSSDLNSNNGKLSLRVEAIDSLLFLRSSAGTGFRLPSLSELYDPDYGDPELEAEKSTSIDAGFDVIYKNLASLKWTFFRNDFENLISSDPATYRSINIGKAMTFGNETEVEVKLHDNVSTSGGYTYLVAKDVANHEDLMYRPKDSFFANIDVSLPYVNWQINYNAYSRSYDKYANPSYQEGYDLLNTTLSFSNDYLDAWFRVMNVLDKEYEVTAGYPQLGRNYYFGVQGKF